MTVDVCFWGITTVSRTKIKLFYLKIFYKCKFLINKLLVMTVAAVTFVFGIETTVA